MIKHAMIILMYAAAAASAFAGVVPVSQDITVNAANEDSNLNNITTRGGLLSGLDDTGSDYSFYLQFSLAAIDPASVDSAALVGTYNDDFAATDSFHQIYFVPDDGWTETSVTWNTRPQHGDATAAAFDAVNHLPGETVRFDITEEVKREAGGDGVLSLAFATIDGRGSDLEFFASREFNPALAFRIETVEATAIPLPPAVLPGIALLISMAGGCLGAADVRKIKPSHP